ncbi:3-isopropylmalate dehydratase small subunit [Ruegeria pomeroyi]|uniref:3-isopropylmalate dehydratase n=1 Tax=Ruegeria alba TaxID=2916756 RepID=A0ABS9NZW4_9RHOB|nr:3-isopropylmalate dehydratase small subunit [Ruegeria alba]MCE8514303.1 3-isopropylmalate dehydratase small subunit [Ruegeria pomeroyi]MCE8521032.1 3-isopropylmalate dehydratase small subunit [Ruegeria pomeroyi]MCE8526636.1 3-isopropylmalate dehydratase small subunit [Ruegeria pomeroyi]MCE8531076.1 3-isopropylmalate dehydratase small subunit [Ruegeria pomeroyi]MCE8533588.1 3-isopropylmalate dehydratase small subunit [Ruegeria pomeroyi]
MAGWSEQRGKAILLPMANIDTDQLIPARFMSTPRAEGYGRFLLHDVRRTSEGEMDPEFPLNAHPDACILVTGRNFGSGSSREAAVYALVDAGIRVVVAPSFGDIFAGNAVNNGLLPARVSEADAKLLTKTLSSGVGTGVADLASRLLLIRGVSVPFQLDDVWRTKLLNGWDDIDLTRHHSAEIAAYRGRILSEPGRFPAGDAP